MRDVGANQRGTVRSRLHAATQCAMELRSYVCRVEGANHSGEVSICLMWGPIRHTKHGYILTTVPIRGGWSSVRTSGSTRSPPITISKVVYSLTTVPIRRRKHGYILTTVPIGRRKHGYTLTTDQSDAGNTG
eukprot:3649579-Pyramimonas_sp.AAC.1